ncbi:hypothetical protein B0H13DRAFT_2341217 [Mycena leptocephala]|nr:hypothetical protein B0H13DRAFT_2341217 [Mycena leptocephala]
MAASPRHPAARHSPNTFQVATQWTLDTDSGIMSYRPRQRPRERYVHPMASVLPHDTHTPPMGHHDHVRKPSVDAAAWIPNARADWCSSLPAPFSARNIQRRCTRVPAAADPAPPMGHHVRKPRVDAVTWIPTCAHADWSPRSVLHTQCTLCAAICHPSPRHRERYDRRTAVAHAHAGPLSEHYIHDAVLPRGSTHTRSLATSACSAIRQPELQTPTHIPSPQTPPVLVPYARSPEKVERRWDVSL